jgi:hypothetical protein
MSHHFDAVYPIAVIVKTIFNPSSISAKLRANTTEFMRYIFKSDSVISLVSYLFYLNFVDLKLVDLKLDPLDLLFFSSFIPNSQACQPAIMAIRCHS